MKIETDEALNISILAETAVERAIKFLRNCKRNGFDTKFTQINVKCWLCHVEVLKPVN